MANVTKINDVEYEFEYKLTNADGQETEYTSSAVRGFTLIDNFFDPFVSGSISIANPYDLMEEAYMIRGDGRDEVSIKLKPLVKDGVAFEGRFVILDEANFGNPGVRSENVKKFNIISASALPFMDKIPYGKGYFGKSGDILKAIFEELLGKDAVEKDSWESGDFILSHTPPLTFRYIDLINYLIKHYYFKDGDVHVKAFIRKNDEGKFEMQPLSKIFEKNKDLVSEAFLLGDMANDPKDASNPSNPPKDADGSQFNAGMKNIGYTTPMYGINTDFFLNTIVHGYDPILGVHKMRKIKLEDIEKKWAKKFVDVFKSVGGKPKPFVVKNKTTKQKLKHYKTAYNIEDSVRLVEAEIHNTLTFYNLRAVFVNTGSFNRTAGGFIDIVKVGSYKMKSDEKLLGRWFVSEIRHILMGDGFHNEFSCCKTYGGSQTNISSDVD